MINDLHRIFVWLSKKLEILTQDDAPCLKVLDGYQKVLKILHDCMKLNGVEESGESLAELFEKLPAKTAKRMLKIIGEIRKSNRLPTS